MFEFMTFSIWRTIFRVRSLPSAPKVTSTYFCPSASPSGEVRRIHAPLPARAQLANAAQRFAVEREILVDEGLREMIGPPVNHMPSQIGLQIGDAGRVDGSIQAGEEIRVIHVSDSAFGAPTAEKNAGQAKKGHSDVSSETGSLW